MRISNLTLFELLERKEGGGVQSTLETEESSQLVQVEPEFPLLSTMTPVPGAELSLTQSW